MTSDDVGTPTGTPTATADDGGAKPQELHTPLRGRITLVGRKKTAQLADQAKTKARHLTDKAGTATQERRRRGAAVTAAVTAAAGIAAGWVIRRRRNRARRSWWARLRRSR